MSIANRRELSDAHAGDPLPIKLENGYLWAVDSPVAQGPR